MTIRLAIRGFARGTLIFEEPIEVGDSEIDIVVPQLAEQHATKLAAHRRHMLEIEFLDEPDVNQRFYRIGTDPSRMVKPIRIDRRRP